MNRIKLKIERFLYKKGFTEAPLRAIILAQLSLLVLSLVIALASFYFSIWFFWFFLGAALLAFNFWSMSRFVLEQLPGGYSRAFLRGQVMRFLGRVLLTGCILTVAILFGGSVAAICLGMFGSLALTAVVALFRLNKSA